MQINIIEEAGKVFDTEIEALTLAKTFLNVEFEEAVNILTTANKVIVSGVGKSGIIARKIAATFSSIGLPSFFMHPADALHGDIGIVTVGDVIILLSKSGATEEIVKMLPYLKNRGAKVISITSNMNSYLAINSDFRLNSFVVAEACPINTAPMASALVTLALGDALAACLILTRKVTLEKFSRQHPLGQIGRNILLKVSNVMHNGEHLPVITPDKSFKEALIVISQKALGAVCVVDSDTTLLGIITDGDVRRVLQNNEEINELKVTEIMTKNPIVIKPESMLGEALGIMENRHSQISVLPVTDDSNKLVGLIRLHDIIRSGI